ncbi:MAG TPA: hypothetical protein VGO47_07465, partial [Chlamydiales bacterium]|nr:hypothetical protein [Chlamydiales bacterium]
MAAVTNTGVASNPLKQCCDQICQAFGRCWTWIVNGFHWCVNKVMQATHAVVFAFFRVVGCFSPTLALKMEAGYGYLRTWYAEHTADVAQKISKTTIADLKSVNRVLHRDVLQNAGDLTALRVEHTRVSSEKKRLAKERNTDIEARVAMEGRCQQMQLETDLNQRRALVLRMENERVNQELQDMIAARAPLLGENRQLLDKLDDVQKQNLLLEMSTRQAQRESDIAYASLQL